MGVEVLIGSGRNVQQLLQPIDFIQPAESPEDAGIQDQSFFREAIDYQVVADAAAEAAELLVDSVSRPERQDIRYQFRLDFCDKRRHQAPRYPSKKEMI